MRLPFISLPLLVSSFFSIWIKEYRFLRATHLHLYRISIYIDIQTAGGHLSCATGIKTSSGYLVCYPSSRSNGIFLANEQIVSPWTTLQLRSTILASIVLYFEIRHSWDLLKNLPDGLQRKVLNISTRQRLFRPGSPLAADEGGKLQSQVIVTCVESKYFMFLNLFLCPAFFKSLNFLC